MTLFSDIREDDLAGKTVLLDIDGTITHDGGSIVSQEVLNKIQKIASEAKVYLCSNGPRERTVRLAELAGISYTVSDYLKPNKRAIGDMIEDSANMYVIGDKYITDGFFAYSLGARFLHVQHIRSRSDSLISRMTYAVDDFIGVCVQAISVCRPYILMLRPLQWVKNLLVMAPIFFSGHFLEPAIFSRALFATIVYCLVASAMYIFNDICDVAQDRVHSRKKRRPLASGAVSVSAAKTMLLILVTLSVVAMAYMPVMIPAMMIYMLLNVAYSLKLKDIPIVDMATVSTFYVLRILAGGFATGTELSIWIVSCVFFGSLFVIAGKRRAEYIQRFHRKVLDRYSVQTLDSVLVISAVLTVFSYGFYAFLGRDLPYLGYSVIFVAIAIYRVLKKVYTDPEEAEAPETLMFKDKTILLSFLFWVSCLFSILYISDVL